jgi:iron complex outermembrane receptor protein
LIQAGASTNKYAFQYRRLTGSDNAKRKKTFDEQFLPRLAVLYPFNQYLSVYTSVSKGFSPATLAEIRPSEGSFYTALQPEFGWNYELGFRGSSANNRLQYNAAIYYFKLKQAIVRRTNAAGAEYFVNAGGTKQKGAELYAGYTIVNNTSGLFNLVKLWSGFTYNDYNFTNYFNASTDYSGNALTGVPKYNSITGLDISISPGFYLHTNLNYTSKLPLNDANDAYAKEYYLLQAKLGWKRNLTPAIAIELFAGVDILLNEHYSLGNDINAVPPAKRYYNPSPLRNYFGGLILQF